MKNKHRIKQCLSLLLAGGIALTNLAQRCQPLRRIPTPRRRQPKPPHRKPLKPMSRHRIFRRSLKICTTICRTRYGSYLGSMGLPVATGETKIGISAWVSDLYDA